jgi:hypothetical protein
LSTPSSLKLCVASDERLGAHVKTLGDTCKTLVSRRARGQLGANEQMGVDIAQAKPYSRLASIKPSTSSSVAGDDSGISRKASKKPD